MSNHSDVPAHATLTTCYKPIEQYLRLAGRGVARARSDGTMAPASDRFIPLRPLDAMLMHQFAALYPRLLAVVDLMADATGGASAAFWASHPGVRHVLVPRVDWLVPSGDEKRSTAIWRDEFPQIAREMEFRAEITLAATSLPQPTGSGLKPPPLRLGGEHELGRHLQGAAPLLFSWAAPLGAAEVGPTLARLLALRPDAVVLFAPLGRIGDPRLGDVLKFVHAGAAEADRYSVLAPRDVCPFFFGSELGLIFPSADPAPRDTLERIGRMYEGNLQFLALAEAATAQARRAKDLEDMVGERRRPAARTGVADPAAYQHLIERIVDAVGSLPAKATVTVISRGDDRLLNLRGRRAWHFPGNEKGEYAGHHPADGADAVARLERQREKGAQYLLLPATANWWLEHYEDFRRHLETRYTAVCVRPETCIIFDVRRQRGRGADGGEKATRSSPRADKGLVRGAVGQAVSPRARAKDQVAARSRNPAPRRRPGAPPQDED